MDNLAHILSPADAFQATCKDGPRRIAGDYYGPIGQRRHLGVFV